MIVLKLMGGLGNQLFQYAYARSLAKEYDEEVVFDTSFYSSGKRLELYSFAIPEHRDWIYVIEENERAEIIKAAKTYRILQKAKRIFFRTEELGESWFKKNIQKGHYFNFDPYFYRFIRTSHEIKYIYGYFQSEKYFLNCSEEIKSFFKSRMQLGVNASNLLRMITACNSVALHIRLGDYKKTRNFYMDVCTPNYYKKALDYIRENVKDPHIFVFTNDVVEVRKIIDLPEGATIIEGTQAYEDFELMRNCAHLIISNSTFSWWASYLNCHKDKIIIAPTPWFKTLKREADIYTQNMIKIEV